MSKYNSLDELLVRNRAFVRREEVDRPLVGVEIQPTMALQRWKRIAKALPSRGPVFPEMLKTEDFLKDVDELVLQHEKVDGDILWAASPPGEMSWMEAIIGCPLHISSHSIWPAPFAHTWRQMKEIDFFRDNKWWQKLIELQTALVEYAKGRYPIASSAAMRGPGDMLTAAVGAERLALELYDNLEKVKNFASMYTKVWIKAIKAQHELVPKFHGGSLPDVFCVWTPGLSQYIGLDSLAFFSPKFYRVVLLEHHRAMVSIAQYSLLHFHPVALYVIDDLMNIKGVSIIEVHREVTGPAIQELLPSLKKIQKHKALLISWCPDSPRKVPLEAEIRDALNYLSPKGLCLHFMAKDVGEGKSIMNLVRRVLRENINRNKG